MTDTSVVNRLLNESLCITYLSLGYKFVLIIFHFFDVGYDTYAAYNYFVDKMYSYFAWTVVFMLIPSAVMTLISIKMYLKDQFNGSLRNVYFRIALSIIGLPIQSSILIRNVDEIWYGYKYVKAKKNSQRIKEEHYHTRMADEESDVSLLKVFECYLESAPQQVLQVTLLLTDFIRGSNNHKIMQLIILISSFVLMGICMANYHRLIRYDQSEERQISYLGLSVQFLWHFFLTVSRILTIAAMATLQPFWTCVAVFCHWMLMSLWVTFFMKTNFCNGNIIWEYLFSSSVGLIYIFNFISLKEGQTRKYYMVFYILCFVENVTAAVLWGLYVSSYLHNYIYHAFAILPVLTFLLGLVFFAIYYQFLHPNLQNSTHKDIICCRTDQTETQSLT